MQRAIQQHGTRSQFQTQFDGGSLLILRQVFALSAVLIRHHKHVRPQEAHQDTYSQEQRHRGAVGQTVLQVGVKASREGSEDPPVAVSTTEANDSDF